MTRGISDKENNNGTKLQIYCHQNRGNLHLKLTGDFDGSSPYELINLLKNYSGIARRIFIHTCFLSSVCSFALDVFQKSSTIKKLSLILTFTGEYGNNLAHHGSIFLKPKSEVCYDNDDRHHIKKKFNDRGLNPFEIKRLIKDVANIMSSIKFIK